MKSLILAPLALLIIFAIGSVTLTQCPYGPFSVCDDGGGSE